MALFVKTKLLKVNQSTTLDFNFQGQNDFDFRIIWSCNIGTIKGEGSEIEFIAPNFKGTATITAKTILNGKITSIEYADILVFKQLIIFKADDLGFVHQSLNFYSKFKRFLKMLLFIKIRAINNEEKRWKLFTDLIIQKKAKASLGLIGKYLENENRFFISYVEKLLNHGVFEIWNHGYDHQRLNMVAENGEPRIEFKNTPFEYQKSHLIKTQNLAQLKLNLKLHTFGAPENAIDEITSRAIDEIDEINIWFYGLDSSNKFIIKRLGEIEFPFFNPDFGQFKKNFDPTISLLTLQVHPMAWDNCKFIEFRKILNYLIKSDVTFINPYEYFLLT